MKSGSDPTERSISNEERKFIRDDESSANLKRNVIKLLDNIDPRMAGDWKFAEDERNELEKYIEKSFMRDTKPKDKDDSHDFSIEMSNRREYESEPISARNKPILQEENETQKIDYSKRDQTIELDFRKKGPNT
jgi:hypothetical protein